MQLSLQDRIFASPHDRFAVLALAITQVLCVPHNISLRANIHGTPNPSARRVAMRRTDWTLSRVNGHIVFLATLVMRLGFATAFLATALIAVPTEPPHTVMRGRCALLVVDVTLCLAIAQTRPDRIHSGAIAIHGDEMVALPPRFVPAWTVGTIAEIDESLRAR
ncbi:hypothetical protein B0H13DRAFT_2378950 [Mycena leptocephala]|nr:hypothetical protein B0H13DRAFT_2378950 [Mycena leptocephala]